VEALRVIGERLEGILIVGFDFALEGWKESEERTAAGGHGGSFRRGVAGACGWHEVGLVCFVDSVYSVIDREVEDREVPRCGGRRCIVGANGIERQSIPVSDNVGRRRDRQEEREANPPERECN
jgi:hypothetical protein